jgi:hypothetical protein
LLSVADGSAGAATPHFTPEQFSRLSNKRVYLSIGNSNWQGILSGYLTHLGFELCSDRELCGVHIFDEINLAKVLTTTLSTTLTSRLADDLIPNLLLSSDIHPQS